MYRLLGHSCPQAGKASGTRHVSLLMQCRPMRTAAARVVVSRPSTSDDHGRRMPQKERPMPASSAFMLRRKEHEAMLAVYTYREPVGAIESMRISDDRRFSGSVERRLAQLSGDNDLAPILGHRVPELHVLHDAQEANDKLKRIKSGEAVSLDSERGMNRLHFHDKVGLIQVASASDIYVLQLHRIGDLPSELVRIINDDTIIKCGVGIKGDSDRILSDYGHQLRNAVELSRLAKLIDVGKKRVTTAISLRDLSRIYLDRHLDKDVKTGDWAAKTLSPRQLEYAASDAYVGLEVLYSLARRRVTEYTGEDVPHDPLNHACMEVILKRARIDIHPNSVNDQARKPEPTRDNGDFSGEKQGADARVPTRLARMNYVSMGAHVTRAPAVRVPTAIARHDTTTSSATRKGQRRS